MIKSIALQNFQSHKDTHIELSPGVNIIIGPSDSGKTAIIRALRWIVFNRPQGDHFRSRWGGPTSVVLDLDNHTITRQKDKVDEYVLGTQSYKAFRTDIPDEISNALNMSKVNLQMQLDSPFLLSQTPGAVAQHFNKVARLDKIDTGLQVIQSEIRKINSLISHKQEDITSTETELLKFSHLEKAEIDIEVLEQLSSVHTGYLQGEKILINLIQDIQDKNGEIQEASVLLELEDAVVLLLSLYNKLEQEQSYVNTLEKLIEDIEEIEQERIERSAMLEDLPLVISILDLYTQYNEIEKQKISLFKAIQSIEDTDVKLEEEKVRQYSKQVVFYELMGDTCPLCGNQIKK